MLQVKGNGVQRGEGRKDPERAGDEPPEDEVQIRGRM